MRQTRVVERRDDGLAGAGCGDDQVAVPVVQLALELEPVQDHLLMRVGTDLQAAHGKGDRAPVLRARRDRERLVEPLGVGLRVVVDEGAVGPVRVEGGLELGEQLGSVRAREFHVPLQAVQQSGPAQVRRADVGRAVARGAPEQPGLGVQPGRPRLVVDLDLRPEVAHQPVQRGVVRRTHVRRGDVTRSGTPRARRSSSSASSTRSPYHFTKAHSNSTPSAVASSARSSEPSLGSDLALVRSAGRDSGTAGRVCSSRHTPGCSCWAAASSCCGPGSTTSPSSCASRRLTAATRSPAGSRSSACVVRRPTKSPSTSACSVSSTGRIVVRNPCRRSARASVSRDS